MSSLPPSPPTPAQIGQARRALAAGDPALAVAHRLTSLFAWRVRPGGFAALARLVVEQKVSVASANAIWARLETGLGVVDPQAVASADEDRLRGFGLSGAKARYVRGLAQADRDGVIDFAALRLLDDEAATAALCRLKGVGRWTAQTYLLFCEGRLDVLPEGDVALQHALRMAEGGAAKPSEAALQGRAQGWRPYRGVAAHLLWAFYGGVKRGEIAPGPAEPSLRS